MRTDSRMYFLLLLLSLFCGDVVAQDKEVTADVKTLSKASVDFSLRLLKTLSKSSQGNIFCSPLSLSTVMAMLEFGAGGKTRLELRTLLGYDQVGLSDEDAHKAFSALPEMMNKSSKGVKLTSANALLVAKSKQVNSTYKTEVARLFGASVREVDFQQSAQVKEDINKWVSNQTEGEITQLLDTVDPSSVLIVLNAVYFKGKWQNVFNSTLTRPKKFFNNGNRKQAKEVPMMLNTIDFDYVDYRGTKVLELPFKGFGVSMLIMLPRKGQDPDILLGNLTAQDLDNIQAQEKATRIKLSLPRFKLEYNRQMTQEMQAMGAMDMFLDSANFSGISKDGVKVSAIFHTATLSVNEEGSEAAAATAAVAVSRSIKGDKKPISICFNRPFIVAIVQRKLYSMILFLGRVSQL